MGTTADKDRHNARYTAAELGGSFVVSVIDEASAETTGKFPIVKARKPAATPPTGAPQIEITQDRQAARRTLQTVGNLAIALLKGALEAPTGAAWVEAAYASLEKFSEYSITISQLAALLGMDERLKARTSDQIYGPIYTRFPDAANEVRFLVGAVAGAARRVAGFGAQQVPADKRAQDFEFAADFHHHGTTFDFCMSTLSYVARTSTPLRDDLLDEILAFARHSALEFSHASMEGARLRRESEPEVAVPDYSDAIEMPDGDLEDVEIALRQYEGRS